MAVYSTVSIGGIYLTRDGLSSGVPCKVLVEGLGPLAPAKIGAIVRAADGTPYKFLQDNEAKGMVIILRPFMITSDVFTSIMGVIDAAEASDSSINITIDGETGSYDLECLADAVPVDLPQESLDGRFQGCVFRFVVAEVN